MRRRIQSGRKKRMLGDSTTCTATCGNGAGTGTASIHSRRKKTRPVRLTASYGSFGAVAGTASPRTAAPPSGIGTCLGTGASAWAFVLPVPQFNRNSSSERNTENSKDKGQRCLVSDFIVRRRNLLLMWISDCGQRLLDYSDDTTCVLFG